MTDEQNLVYTEGLLLQARIELEAMLAANQERFVKGQAQAYDEAAFIALIEKHGIHHNALITNIYGRS